MLVEELEFPFKIVGLLDEFGVGLFVLFTLLAEEHVRLYEVVSLFFELGFPLNHFISDLLFVGCVFEVV